MLKCMSNEIMLNFVLLLALFFHETNVKFQERGFPIVDGCHGDAVVYVLTSRVHTHTHS